MFEINRDVTCTVFQNYHFTVDEKVMAELNHYLDAEFGVAPITEEEAAAFMAIYHHYNEYNCPADFLGSKYKARAKEICRYKGWDEQEYTDFLFRIVAEYIDEYVWESFKETIASDTEGWTDELRVIKG